MTVTPSGFALGAYVDVDFKNATNDQIVKIEEELNKHLVLILPNNPMSDEEQVANINRFGTSVIHPDQVPGEVGAHHKFKEILVVSNEGGVLGSSEVHWHSDTYAQDERIGLAILKAVKLVAVDVGLTFCNMKALYHAVPKILRDRLDDLTIHHQKVRYPDRRLRQGAVEPESDDVRTWPNVSRPLVGISKATGEKFLDLGAETGISWISQDGVNWPAEESDNLIAMLWRLADDPKFHFTVHWRPGDVVMWANLETQHRRGGWDGKGVRTLHRTAIEA